MATIEAVVEQKRSQGLKPNRLIHEKSPYLLQHAFNPVHWFPWGDEPFEIARREDKPVFLSIGYSTCYWCHVMEREVFENERIAEVMNSHLVCIKVDREERPDIDRVYMATVQALSGSGGWPLSVFLTPDRNPFFGGTYFPPTSMYNRPGFPQIVERISQVWSSEKDKVLESSGAIINHLKQISHLPPAGSDSPDPVMRCFESLLNHYDAEHGGFGTAPKFPRPVTLKFLLHYSYYNDSAKARNMAISTLRAMARGGIYDQLGGGFHRYSVDAGWRVPHFEKMLYDQAQLIHAYLDAYQVTGEREFADIARETIDYVLRNLTSIDGAFYSAEDAESAITVDEPDKKAEGYFYLWEKTDIERLLEPEMAAVVIHHFGLRAEGNTLDDPHGVFGSRNVLFAAHTIEDTATATGHGIEETEAILKKARSALLIERERRPKPHTDDKIIAAWNGLMISALARASQVLDERRYLTSAEIATEFILKTMFVERRLKRRYREGDARFEGCLQDYAFLGMGLLDLFDASGDERWLSFAMELTSIQIDLFSDQMHGGFFDSVADDLSAIVRMKEDYDGAEPTGNSVAAVNLLRLSMMLDRNDLRERALQLLETFRGRMQQIPEALPLMLTGLDLTKRESVEIVLVGHRNAPDTRRMQKEIHSRFLPNVVLIHKESHDVESLVTRALPFVADMKAIGGKATAYICQNRTCQLPTTDPAAVAEQLSNYPR